MHNVSGRFFLARVVLTMELKTSQWYALKSFETTITREGKGFFLFCFCWYVKHGLTGGHITKSRARRISLGKAPVHDFLVSIKKKKHVTLNGKRHIQKAVKRIAVFDYNTKVVTQHNSKPKVRFFRKPLSSQTSFVHFTGLLRPFQMAQALNLEGKPKIMKNI